MVENKTKKNNSGGKKKVNVEEVLFIINIPYHICNHVMGENHSVSHRVGAGFVLMAIGVVIAHSAATCPIIILSYVGDGFGYLLHGIGSLPLAEAAIPLFLRRVDSKKEAEEEVEEEA